MGKRPIVDRMVKFYDNRPISFHVPGHKHGLLTELPRAFRDGWAAGCHTCPRCGANHHPEEVIDEAQTLLAKAYGANKSYFLVNGSTVGNLAMVYASCMEGDTVFVQRNAH